MLISRVTPQLRTCDLDASVRFYTEKVGLVLEFRYSDFYAGIRAGEQVFTSNWPIVQTRRSPSFRLVTICIFTSERMMWML
jgi:catechol 2,3-dioxygenase-like lactoylglutathione lyase family enzyme